ncbi:hypothetical protein V8F06_003655 [Rhypophila decipiens]
MGIKPISASKIEIIIVLIIETLYWLGKLFFTRWKILPYFLSISCCLLVVMFSE